MKYATGGLIHPIPTDDGSVPILLNGGCGMTIPAEMKPSAAMRLLEALNAAAVSQCSQP